MSTKTKTLQRNYDKLTDLERFRAVMAAYERDDEGEVQALGRTAPKATYKMTAWPYRGMLDGIQRAAWCMVTDVLGSGLLMIMAWGIDRARRAKEHYERADIEEEADIEDYKFDAWEFAKEKAESVMAEWAGLALFCAELGITVEQALAHVPTPPALTIALDFARDILVLEDKFAFYLAQDVCELGEEELEELLAERETNLAEQRAEGAGEIADVLKQVWEMDVKG